MSTNSKKIFKIVLLGEPSVGKTSLCRRYMGQGFQENYLATLGAEFVIKELDDVQLLIWDIGGHKNFRNIFKAYLSGSQGLILVCDVMRPDTLANIDKWVDYYIEANNKIAPSILVTNKIDLRSEDGGALQETDARSRLDQLSKKYNQEFRYIETSAKTGENIEEAFENLIDWLLEVYLGKTR